ncbi:MAG: type II secretion system protein [Oscillospiraceae bacterium]
MIKRLKSTFSNKSGMTLVETIIGVVLLAIASLMLMTGFMTAGSLINEANIYKTSSAKVATAVEVKSSLTSSDEISVGIKNGNFEYTKIPGKFLHYEDPDTHIKYKVFLPNTIPQSNQ